MMNNPLKSLFFLAAYNHHKEFILINLWTKTFSNGYKDLEN